MKKKKNGQTKKEKTSSIEWVAMKPTMTEVQQRLPGRNNDTVLDEMAQVDKRLNSTRTCATSPRLLVCLICPSLGYLPRPIFRLLYSLLSLFASQWRRINADPLKEKKKKEKEEDREEWEKRDTNELRK